jgi:hypothetical protein
MPRRLRTWVGLVAIPLVSVFLWYVLFGGRLGKTPGEVLREFAALMAVDLLLAIWFIRRSEGRFPWL